VPEIFACSYLSLCLSRARTVSRLAGRFRPKRKPTRRILTIRPRRIIIYDLPTRRNSIREPLNEIIYERTSESYETHERNNRRRGSSSDGRLLNSPYICAGNIRKKSRENWYNVRVSLIYTRIYTRARICIRSVVLGPKFRLFRPRHNVYYSSPLTIR